MSAPEELLRPADLEGIRRLALIASRFVDGTLVGLHQSEKHGSSLEFAEYRQYVPGDDLRSFDWKAFGRSDRPYIKKFHSETDLTAHFVVDASASMGYGEPGPKLRYATATAAALAHLFVAQQDAVSLVAPGAREEPAVPAGRGTGHLAGVVELLASLEPGGPSRAEQPGELPRRLEELAGSTRRRGICLVFSDLYEDDLQLREAIRHLRFRGHEVLVFHLLHPSERELDFERAREFVDLETGERLEVHPPSLREAYRRRFAAWLGETREALAAAGAELIEVDTTRPFAEVLARYLYWRRAASRGAVRS